MDILEYIVGKAQKLGADDVIATTLDETTRQVRFANNDVTLNTIWDTNDVEVFLALKKRLITSELKNPSQSETFTQVAKTKNITKGDVDKFLERMVRMAKMMQPKKDYYGIAKGNFKYGRLKNGYDRKVANLAEENVDFVNEAVNAATDEGAKRCAGVLYSSVWKEEKYTSNGVKAKDKGTSINISLRAFREKDESGHSVSVSRMLSQFSPKSVGEEAGRLASEYRSPVAGEGGRYDIIFNPMIMADLLNYMSYAFSAFEVEAGSSFLMGKMEKSVANENVTILDDGRLPNGFGSSLFDEEGRPTQTTKIISNGVLKTYLHNTSTAKKFGVKATGNSGLVYPSYWNLVLDKGDSSLDEMVSEVKNGIYITNNWYTRFKDYLAGDFSTIPRDAMFEIKDGKISRPVKGLRLSDNMKNILKNIESISKDRRPIQWWEVDKPVLTGWVLCRGLNMTRSTK